MLPVRPFRRLNLIEYRGRRKEPTLPSILALLLGIGFIIHLLYLDHQQFPEASLGLWIPTIWLLTVSTKALGTWFGTTGSFVMEEGSSLDRNFLLILMGIAIIMLIRRRPSLAEILQENVWLIVLFAFMLISISWSQVPFISLKRWMREVIAIIMGLVITTEKDPRRAIETVVRRTVYILIPLSIVLIKYYPRYGVDYVGWSGMTMWIGVTDQKNEFGQLTCFAAFFLIWSLWRRRGRTDSQKIRYLKITDLAVLAIALYLTKGAEAGYSATSLVMLVFGLLLYAGLLWLKKKGKIVSQSAVTTFIGFLVLYGTLTPLVGRLPVVDITSSLGRDSTLTERTINWAALVPSATAKPLLGHGVGGFWTTVRVGRYYFPAHNGYLEVILVLGFIGLLIVSFYLLSSARKAWVLLTGEYDWGVLWICWLAMALLNNITESSLNSFANLLMAVPLWLALSHKVRVGQSP